MKIRNRQFRVGYKTYYHYRYGIVNRSNHRRNFALSMSAIMLITGGFFVGSEYALPLLRSNGGIQRVQQLTADKLVAAEEQPGSPSAQPIRQEDELLRSVLEDKINTLPADQKWSVFVYDLNTERTAHVNADATYSSASLYKLFLLEALEKKLAFDQWQWTRVGGKSVTDCVNTMLRASDDPCAQALGDFIGWDQVSRVNREAGYKNTSFSETEGRQTSAADVGELLARLKRSQILSDDARRSIFDSLYQQTIKKGMAKGCRDCRTANKLGELQGFAHDAGIVTHGSHSYVLVVMSQGGNLKQISEIAKLVELQFAPN